MNGKPMRALATILIGGALCAAVALFIVLYLIHVPGSVAAARTSTGYRLYLATVPAAEPSDPNPTWVSYYGVDANSRHWRHDTTFRLPANSLVHVTVFEYDTSTGLRNPFISQPRGIVGPMLVNGKPVQVVNPATPAHTFAIAQIGLSVPFEGEPANANNLCNNAPCSLSNAHMTISFTFRTPGKGLYRWQCFVPCAAGFIQGNGGPMQTEGYMDGYIKVV